MDFVFTPECEPRALLRCRGKNMRDISRMRLLALLALPLVSANGEYNTGDPVTLYANKVRALIFYVV